MTEDEAKAWIVARHGPEARAQLEVLVDRVVAESARQNLIAASTLPHIWARHIVDSAQLLRWDRSGPWLDIGTGAGFPGMVVAAIRGGVTMVEPRRGRVEFLQSCLDALGVAKDNRVLRGKVETLPAAPFSIISARAVASLPTLFAAASHCATNETLWLLPKGQSAADEVAQSRQTWHGMFHVEHSATNAEALIVVAKGIRRR
jgi:16S rRNA (guanine527-N7)-methyltransferase